VRFYTAGKEKSDVYDCLVPFDDKNMEPIIDWLLLLSDTTYATIIIGPHHRTTYINVTNCYRPSSVVCRSVCRSVTDWALQKQLKRAKCRLRWGLRWTQ